MYKTAWLHIHIPSMAQRYCKVLLKNMVCLHSSDQGHGITMLLLLFFVRMHIVLHLLYLVTHKNLLTISNGVQ